jgi:4-hydroxybenzoyl-CoA reductase subunit beta
MRLPPFLYLAPRTCDEALAMMSRYGGKVRIVAGGTDVMNLLRQRLLTPSYVMSLKGVADLTGIKKKGGALVIAAGTTLRDIEEAPDIRRSFAAIAQSAKLVAAPPIRNIATIGGNLLQDTRCLFYNQSEMVRKAAPPCLKQGGKVCAAVSGSKRCFSVYQGDMAPSLIACNASAVVKKAGGSRTVPVEALFSGRGTRPLSIADDEILTHIIVPIPKGECGSSYQKLRLRTGLEYPLISSAVFVGVSKKGLIDRARIVIGAASPAPVIDEKAAACLVGRRPEEVDSGGVADQAVRAVRPVDNLALDGRYRKKMAKVFTKRAIEASLAALQKAGG